jgi:hypothetical protein
MKPEAGWYCTQCNAVKLIAKLFFLPIVDKIELGAYLKNGGAVERRIYTGTSGS